jgi:hypothetical protein
MLSVPVKDRESAVPTFSRVRDLIFINGSSNPSGNLGSVSQWRETESIMTTNHTNGASVGGDTHPASMLNKQLDPQFILNALLDNLPTGVTMFGSNLEMILLPHGETVLS